MVSVIEEDNMQIKQGSHFDCPVSFRLHVGSKSAQFLTHQMVQGKYSNTVSGITLIFALCPALLFQAINLSPAHARL